MDKRNSAAQGRDGETRNQNQNPHPGEPSHSTRTLMLPAATFDYGALPDEVANTATEAAAEIKRRHKEILPHVLAIGEKLCAVRKILPHGQFGDWITAEFSWSSRTAQNYMADWEQFGDKCEIISDLSPTTVYALAAPSASAVREQVISKFEAGEQIEPAAVREMLQKPRTTAKPAKAAIEAKEEEPERPLLSERWHQCSGEPEEAAELLDNFLKERLGEEFPTFVTILHQVGWSYLRNKLQLDMLPDGVTTRGPEDD